MAIEETTRLGLPTYTSGSDFHPQRADFNQRMELLDQLAAIVEQGAHADRPLPETKGRLWMSTDTEDLYYDTGSEWIKVVRIGSGGAGENVVVDGAASEGSSNRAARADHTHNLTLATASEPGAMSAADKADIDDATSTDTPSTLVRRDGSGRTGVNDPDTGVHAANKRYVDSTVDSAVADKVTEHGNLGDVDLNTITDPGIYYENQGSYISTGNNYPQSADAGVLTVANPGHQRIAQLWREVNGETFHRAQYDGEWSDWLQYADTSTATSSDDGLMSAADKDKLDDVDGEIATREPSLTVDTSAGTKVVTSAGQVIHYDSGWRDITADITDQWVRTDWSQGGLFIRRENHLVTLAVRLDIADPPLTTRSTSNSTDNNLLSIDIPDEWRPWPGMGGPTGRLMRYSNQDFPVVIHWGFYNAPRLFCEDSTAVDWEPGENVRGMVQWTVDTPPPTTLPGVEANT